MGVCLLIGGLFGGNPTRVIHCYNVTTNSWSVLGDMPTPRSQVQAAVLPSNDLVVVGGQLSGSEVCLVTEISSCL